MKRKKVMESILEPFLGNAIPCGTKGGKGKAVLFTVGEVSAITGMSRKLLFDYKELVPPADFRTRGYEDRNGITYGGYKLYDVDGLYTFLLISVFRKMGMKRAQIKQMLSEKDQKEALEKWQRTHLHVLMEEKEKLEEQLHFAERILEIGIDSYIRQMLEQEER